jgi:hypothetical protein
LARTLTIRDETTFDFGGADEGFTLDLLSERITVREVIRTRVYQEVPTTSTGRSTSAVSSSLPMRRGPLTA